VGHALKILHADWSAQTILGTAMGDAKDYFASNASFSGFNAGAASSADPSLTWADTGADVQNVVTIQCSGTTSGHACVADGSTDSTAEVILSTQSASGNRFCVAAQLETSGVVTGLVHGSIAAASTFSFDGATRPSQCGPTGSTW
jgi:hypothetical protein